jgi:uncharacterized membrane protein YuzA (DUF378 family)
MRNSGKPSSGGGGRKGTRMKALNIIAWILITIGAINWGLVALMEMNVVDTVFGVGSQLAKIIYILIGAAGVYNLIPLSKCLMGQGGGACCS